MAKLKGRAKELAALQERPKKGTFRLQNPHAVLFWIGFLPNSSSIDYDPEAQAPPTDHSESDSDSEVQKQETEHYVQVSKGKLRHKEPAFLGPEYSGARVSRAELEYEGHDPFGSGSDPDDDDEENCDEDDTQEGDKAQSCYSLLSNQVIRNGLNRAAARSRESRLKAVDFMDFDSENSHEPGPGISGENLEMQDTEDGATSASKQKNADQDEDMMSSSELNYAPSSASAKSEEEHSNDMHDEREDDSDTGSNSDKITNNDQDLASRGMRSTLSRLSASFQKDSAQGVAFRQQRKIFDLILNLRVRMQKALVATNSFDVVEADKPSHKDYNMAEEAALKLWNTLDSLRARIQPDAYSKVRHVQKRKADALTSTRDIWESMMLVEKRAAVLRKANLEKWSEKANRGYISSSRDKLENKLRRKFTAGLDGQLANPETLVNRSRIPRACAPIQAKGKKMEDEDIYDDTDFYQLLLKELLDRRTSESSGGVHGNVTTVVFTAQKEAKPKSIVDTKASKGRKMRFNVHEKLVDFMAKEDRRSWEKEAIDRLFVSLFGKKVELIEEDSESDKETEDVAREEEIALRLFRGQGFGPNSKSSDIQVA